MIGVKLNCLQSFSSMSFPEHLEISINTVFQLFSHQDDQILTHSDLIQLLGFVFTEFGITRPVDQIDLESFLREINLQNEQQILKSHFEHQKFLNFNRKNTQNNSAPEMIDLKIPVQPFVQQLCALGCEVIERQKVRQFLVNVNSVLQIPKPVEDSDVQKFILDFDKNGDGQLQTSDLEGIEYLKFRVRKCRRYQ